MWLGDLKSIMFYSAVMSMVECKDCESSNNQISFRVSGPAIDKNSNTNDNAIQNINEPPVQRPRNRCCPYDFDSSICKEIDDRVLCGFNRNIGRPISKNKPIDLSDGCRLRGGRLECGYVNGPYTNPRRPPVWYNYGSMESNQQNVDLNEEEIGSSPEVTIEKQKLKMQSTPYSKPVTRCVEIQDRIVCREM